MSTKSGKRNPGGIQKSISSSNNSQASKSPSSDASGSKVTRARSVKHTAQTTANTKDADNENDAEDEEARRQLEQQSETKVQNEIMMLYGASQAALNSVHHMMNILNYKVDSLTRAIESNVYPLFCHQQQSLNHSTWLQGFAPTQRSRSSVHNNKSNTASSRPVTAFPNIPAKLPDKLLTLVDQHVSLDLKKFEHAKKDLWPNPTRMAYSRRKYLFSKVEENARSLRTGEWEEKLKEAAMEMDRARIPRSLTKYMGQLKEADTSVEKRQSRKRRANSDMQGENSSG